MPTCSPSPWRARSSTIMLALSWDFNLETRFLRLYALHDSSAGGGLRCSVAGTNPPVFHRLPRCT